MPWLVSMRIIGSVIGAPLIVATRRSVIFNSVGFELVLTCSVAASSVWSSQKLSPSAAVMEPRKERLASINESLYSLSRRSRLRGRNAVVAQFENYATSAWVGLV